MMLKRLPYIILLTLLTASCFHDSNPYGTFRTFSDSRWMYGDTVRFLPDETADSVMTGELLLMIRHSRDYRYSNIWLEVSTLMNDSTIARDTVNIHLADDFGRWYGKGLGTDFMVSDTLDRNFSLVRGRTISVRHIMRTDTLDAIEQIGLVFKPIK